MTDIVERLHWCPEYGGWSDAIVLMPMAADEIERLRAALEKIEEETERTCQQCRLIENIARAALEPKP
jgi:hypothetical protein